MSHEVVHICEPQPPERVRVRSRARVGVSIKVEHMVGSKVRVASEVQARAHLVRGRGARLQLARASGYVQRSAGHLHVYTGWW